MPVVDFAKNVLLPVAVVEIDEGLHTNMTAAHAAQNAEMNDDLEVRPRANIVKTAKDEIEETMEDNDDESMAITQGP